MGLWHEVARLPNAFEKDLRNLTEDYSQSSDSTIRVITRAFNTVKTFNTVKNKPVEASGTIKARGSKARGELKVAYDLPIYLD